MTKKMIKTKTVSKSKNSLIRSDEEIIEFLGKKFKLPYFEEEMVDIKNITRMDVKHYEDDMEALPGLLNILGILQAKAMKRVKNLETDYNIWRAEKDLQLREELENNSEKFTENKINNLIRSEEEYKKKKRALNRANEEADIFRSIYWSLNKKSEFLIEISRQRSNFNKVSNLRIKD